MPPESRGQRSQQSAASPDVESERWGFRLSAISCRGNRSAWRPAAYECGLTAGAAGDQLSLKLAIPSGNFVRSAIVPAAASEVGSPTSWWRPDKPRVKQQKPSSRFNQSMPRSRRYIGRRRSHDAVRRTRVSKASAGGEREISVMSAPGMLKAAQRFITEQFRRRKLRPPVKPGEQAISTATVQVKQRRRGVAASRSKGKQSFGKLGAVVLE